MWRLHLKIFKVRWAKVFVGSKIIAKFSQLHNSNHHSNLEIVARALPKKSQLNHFIIVFDCKPWSAVSLGERVLQFCYEQG